MKTFFEDVFEYHHHTNQKLADLLILHADIVSERGRFLFSHSINAHQIWNSRVLDNIPLDVNQIHSFQECKSIDSNNLNDTFTILATFDMDKSISYTNSKGGKFQNTIQEILFHISNHFSHHRGQLMSELRKGGIEPIATDYIFFKR